MPRSEINMEERTQGPGDVAPILCSILESLRPFDLPQSQFPLL